MKKIRQPSEVTLKNGKTLEEVLRLHKKWLDNEEGGERLDLYGEDLRYVNLSGVNLSWADLKGVDLTYVNLSWADLSNTNLSDANLICVNLKGANLRGTDLENCKFYLTNLYKCKGDFVSVGNIGSRNDTTHYFYKDNRIICGCFDGTMEEFEKKVKESYGEDDKEYRQYMFAIYVLKRFAEIELEVI